MVLLLAGARTAHAEEPPAPTAPAAPAPDHRSVANLDGHYLTIGPVAGAARAEDTWNSFVGAELSWVRVREHRTPAALGIALGAVSWSGLPGGKGWVELEVGFKNPVPGIPLSVGLGAGPVVELDRVDPPRWGAQGTLWFFAGFIPYVRVGAVEDRGVFVEAGLMIKIPRKILY